MSFSNHHKEDIGSASMAIEKLADTLRLWITTQGSRHDLATKSDLKLLQKTIMSAISDFATKLNAFIDRQDAAIADLQGDVQTLNDTIAKLQASAGQVTPEDQALLDAITTRGQAVADKLDALDALTPPPTPPTP